MGKFSKNLGKAADDAERLSRALGGLESVGGGGGGAGGEGNTIATPQSPSEGRSVQTPPVVNFFTTVESTGGGGGGGNSEVNLSGKELRKAMLSIVGSLRKNYNFDAGLFLRSGGGG